MISATSVNCGVAEAAGRERRRADAQTRGDHRRARVERHGVAVDRDADLVQHVLGLLAVELRVAQVGEHQVHVGAAGEHVDAAGARVLGGQAVGQDLRAADGALLAVAELLGRGELERGRLGGDHVHQRAALLAGEDVGVELLGQLRVARHDEAGTRAADGLVHGGADDVGERHGRRVQPRGDETGEVRHVDPELRADLVGDRAERGEVEVARSTRTSRR